MILTVSGLRYHRASNMPFWKIDKYVRREIGANPFRAHDAIGVVNIHRQLEWVLVRDRRIVGQAAVVHVGCGFEHRALLLLALFQCVGF